MGLNSQVSVWWVGWLILGVVGDVVMSGTCSAVRELKGGDRVV